MVCINCGREVTKKPDEIWVHANGFVYCEANSFETLAKPVKLRS